MATQKSKWTDSIGTPINVLNHAESLRLEKFTSEDLAQLDGCPDVFRLELVSSKTEEPIDLRRLAHITSLRLLTLEQVKYTHLSALKALPHLRHLSIHNGGFADFDALHGLAALQSLTLRSSKLAAFPAGLDLPQLEDLDLADNKITDLGFVASYPRLRELHLDGNRATDLAPLAACSSLEKLNLNTNPIESLAALAGRKFKTLHVDAPLREEKAALGLELPEPPYQQDTEQTEVSRIVRLITAKDWAQVYAIEDSPTLRKAFCYAINDRADEAMVRGVLAHPGAFHSAVIGALDSRYSKVRDMVAGIFSEYGDRLVEPLTERFHSALAMQYYDSDFQRGKLKNEHGAITGALLKIASPAYTDLFLAFFNQREGFSQAHLFMYKQLLDVVGKTGSPLLLEPLIDLLRFEKCIIGGDNVFMKKILKSVSQLGRPLHAPLLEARFDIAAETRPDVQEAYAAAIARLKKKKD